MEKLTPKIIEDNFNYNTEMQTVQTLPMDDDGGAKNLHSYITTQREERCGGGGNQQLDLQANPFVDNILK